MGHTLRTQNLLEPEPKFGRVITPCDESSKRKKIVEKIESLKNRLKIEFFKKILKRKKLENVESFNNYQTRTDQNRLPMPWNRYTRRTPDSVSADDMSLKRDVPQIGTDGQ